MLHEGYTEESSDKLLKIGKLGEELPDGVYAVERVVSSRQRGSVSSVALLNTRVYTIIGLVCLCWLENRVLGTVGWLQQRGCLLGCS